MEAIENLLDHEWQVQILHYYHEANKVAVHLSNYAHELQDQVKACQVCYLTPSCYLSDLG